MIGEIVGNGKPSTILLIAVGMVRKLVTTENTNI